MSNQVDHPDHYGGRDNKFEAIKIIEAYKLGFHLGNSIKYILRAGRKTSDPTQDIEKAIWYLKRYLSNHHLDEKTIRIQSPCRLN